MWLGFRHGELERSDLQTWFAAHELLMRRCTLTSGRRAAYSVQELEALTGLLAATLRGCIGRLERAGLMSWPEQQLLVKDGATGVLAAIPGLPKMCSALTNHRRTIPIPRHTVLLLARTRRPVLLATLLGHLLRGMYYRSGDCLSWGTCKASWIAQTFGVDVRNVKAARRELESLGWMRPLESPHWHRQRYGRSFVIALAWDSRVHLVASAAPKRVSPPRTRHFQGKSPPPESYRNLLKENNHQNPAIARRAGVQEQAQKPSIQSHFGHFSPADLVDPRRTKELFYRASAAGFVQATVAERLRFFAAAHRARRIGRSPCGLFVWLVRQRQFRFATDADEQAARAQLVRMPEFYFGPPSPLPAMAESGARNIASKCRESAKRRNPDEHDPSAIRRLIRESLDSASLTQPSPSHLMVDRIFCGAERGQEENVAQRPAGRPPPHFVLEAVELRP